MIHVNNRAVNVSAAKDITEKTVVDYVLTNNETVSSAANSIFMALKWLAILCHMGLLVALGELLAYPTSLV